MHLGISTACFYPLAMEETFSVIASLGLNAIEVFLNTESETKPEFAKMLRREAEANGLSIVSVHPFTSLMEGMLLFSDYPRRTEDGMEQYKRYFECAANLGAQFLTFHGERNVGQKKDTPEAAERKLKAYRRLVAISREAGITLAQENVAWCRSADPAYLRMLYQSIPELRYTLDIKQAYRSGIDWRNVVDAVGDRIVNVHINDYSKEQSCLLPGEGEMDYGAFYARLKKEGYRGHTLIEVYRSNFSSMIQMERAVQTLSKYTSV